VRFQTWLVAALLFGSGFCALVYQVAWLRDFRLIFGASTAASAAVLAIFIGGLGLGGLLLGPHADRHPRPLALYARLELIVALSAAATPLLLMIVRFLYLASGGSTVLGSTLATAARVALSAVVLAVPTLAMGGTLPAAARAATRQTDARRQDVAAVYALNTLGAVVGCLAATFWLLEEFGTHGAIWIAAAANVVVALVAGVIGRSVGSTVDSRQSSVDFSPNPETFEEAPLTDAVENNRPMPDTAQEHRVRSKGKKGRRSVAAHAPRGTPQPSPAGTPADLRPLNSSAELAPEGVTSVWFLLLASGTVGFAFFLMELVWYRLLAPLLGGSVFTFGLVLAVALTGIGLGGLLYALLASNKPASLSGFAWTCLLEAGAVAGTYALGDRIALVAVTLLPLGLTGFATRIVSWTFITAIVVLPPAIVAGYQFPLLIALFGRARTDVGQQIGRAYAANTLGAIVGSLAGGFGLLPWLSAVGAWQLVAIVLTILGACAVVLSTISGPLQPSASPETEHLPAWRWRVAAGQGLLALIAIVLISAEGPTAVWRHSGIGAGRVSPTQALGSRNRVLDWTTLTRRSVVWEGDGTESGVALVQNRTGIAFIVNGKSDGSARSDSGTQIMGGLIGALSHPDPRRALVIGLGTGSTGGWLGAVPSIERVDVVELEPLILDVARASAAVNADVLNNPKVHITIGDARETLLTSRDQYDLIASEPSNPYRAGIASLFTLEYYRAVHDRLSDAGVFVQWVQAYEIDTPTLRTIYATLAQVFPQIETWHTNPGDLVLVAQKRPRRYRASEFASRVAAEPYKSALSFAWRAIDVHGFLAHYLANDTLARRIAATPGVDLNTDNRNVVEFRLARSVGVSLSTVADIRNIARDIEAARPPLDDDAAVQWPAVETAWMSYTMSMGSFLDTRPKGPPAEQARQAALVAYYRDDDLVAARGLWEQQQEGARDPTEMAMLADITSDTGREESVPFIDRLRQHRPGEADVMLTALRLRQAKPAEAANALESALVRFRTDPWTMSRYMDRAVQLAQVIGGGDGAMARRMFDALDKPFAVLASDEVRLATRAELTRRVDFPGLCRPAVTALEPHVPWIETFLRLRRDCYAATNDARLSAADADLNEFLANSAQPLVNR
jgi:spermidine synthase